MSASTQHRRLSPVRACVLLIVVYLTVCAALFADDGRLPARSEWSQLFPTLFAEETPPARREWSDSLQPREDIRFRTQRAQRTQRANEDRVQDFYDSTRGIKVEQEREEDRMNRYRIIRSSSRYGGQSRSGGFAPFDSPHTGHRR